MKYRRIGDWKSRTASKCLVIYEKVLDKKAVLNTVYLLLISNLLFTALIPASQAAETTKSANAHFLGGMVPEGRWAAVFSTRYRTSTEVFNDDGDRESITEDTDGIALDSQVIPFLASFGPGASLGGVSLDAKIYEWRHDITVGYGLNKDFTIGFSIPYGHNKTSVNFKMLGGNLASNPFFDPTQPISVTNPSVVPIGTFGTTVPVGTAGVQDILTNPIYGYQYESIQSTRTASIGDPLVGFRWRFHTDSVSSAIFTPVIRIGMSDEEDPNDLFDLYVDDGSTDIRIQLEYIRALPKNFDARARLRYTWQLPDEVTKRAYAEGEYLVPYNRTEKLDRDLGDITEAYLELGYNRTDWRLFGALQAMRKSGDNYTSPSDQDVRGLEAGTAQEEDLFAIGLSWSGVKKWREKKLPLPLVLKAAYQTHLAGRNRLDRKEYQLEVIAVF